MHHLLTIAILSITPLIGWSIYRSVRTAWPVIIETVVAGLALEREAGQ